VIELESRRVYARQHDEAFGTTCPHLMGSTPFAIDMFGWPGVMTMSLPIPEHIVNEMTPDEVVSALYTEYAWDHGDERGVTNELVISHANPDCKTCSGHGYTGPEEAGEVCEAEGCASELFEIAYRDRMRWNKQKRRFEVFV
jgi:hypothetical protein